MQFSIIIPAKNEEANIGRCLDSISRMTFDTSQYEVIVVDNGSTDKTVEIARQKGATVYVEPDLTIAGLRNFGASQARGQIYAFLDADCAVSAQWLEFASHYLDPAENIVAFGSPAVVPEGGTWVQKAWFNVRGRAGEVVDVDWLESANLFVKSSAFRTVHGFDESLVTCEDYDLTQKLKAVGRLVSDYRVMAIHYREPATIREFIKKEIWRGKNNYTGIFKRKIDKEEIPSLILPLIYLVFWVISLLLLVACLIGMDKRYLFYLFGILLLWQVPIIFVSFRKNKTDEIKTVLQLYVLFNAYFFARSLVPVRWK